MRVILSLLVAAFAMGTLSCGNKDRSKVRERGNLTEQEYHAISDLNTMLSDNDAAVDYALKWDGTSADGGIEPMISAKATALGKVLRDERSSGACVPSSQEPGKDFSTGWSAKQTFSGSGCPVFSSRTWRWEYRPANNTEILWVSHAFSVKPEGKTFLEAGGVKEVRANESKILVTRKASTGTVNIQGLIYYDRIILADGSMLRAQISTQQSYRGNSGNGTVTIRLSQPGKWTRTGTITWNGSDFSNRTYAAEGGKMNQESFLELFSFFRLDEIVDNSERMR